MDDADFEIRICDGRVLSYGMEVDDCLDINYRIYQVNGKLPQKDFGRLCFAAGVKVGKKLARSRAPLPYAGNVD